jgi:hypothetical protein
MNHKASFISLVSGRDGTLSQGRPCHIGGRHLTVTQQLCQKMILGQGHSQSKNSRQAMLRCFQGDLLGDKQNVFIGKGLAFII